MHFLLGIPSPNGECRTNMFFERTAVNCRLGHGRQRLIATCGEWRLAVNHVTLTMYNIPKDCCNLSKPLHGNSITLSGLFEQDNVHCHTLKMVLECSEQHNKFKVLIFKDLQNPRPQSYWASVGCPGQTSLIHSGPNWKLKGLKGSSAYCKCWCQIQLTFRDLMESMPPLVRTVLAAKVKVTEY